MSSWRNWARTHSCKPHAIAYPHSHDEVQALIAQCAKAKRPFKVVGHGNAYNRLFHTEGLLLSLKHLDAVLDIDTQQQTITVEAGMPLRRLVQLAADKGLAFSSLGTNMFDNIAGACFAGHHGSGLAYGCLSTALLAFTLIDPQGRVHQIKRGDWLYDALGVGLGAAGVVTQLTLQLEPYYRLYEETRPTQLESFCYSLNDTLSRHDHVKLLWAPHTKQYQSYVANRQSMRANTRLFFCWQAFWCAGVLNTLFHAVALYGLACVKKGTAGLNALLGRLFFAKKGRRVGDSEQIFRIPHYLKQDAIEVAVPLADTLAFMQDLQTLLGPESPFKDVEFPIEVRFVKGDGFWLSPAYQQDSCYVGAKAHLLPGRPRRYRATFDAVSKLAERYQGRPHWAKQLDMSPAYLQAVFPKWCDFWTLIYRLDPQGLCQNSQLRQWAYTPTSADVADFDQRYDCRAL